MTYLTETEQTGGLIATADIAGLVRRQAKRIAELEAAVLAEREACLGLLKSRRNGSYNDWTTPDEQRLIDVIMADIRARPAP